MKLDLNGVLDLEAPVSITKGTGAVGTESEVESEVETTEAVTPLEVEPVVGVTVV